MTPPRVVATSVVALVLLGACGDADAGSSTAEGSGDAAAPETITLYTCVSDTTIQPVIERFEQDHDGYTVDLFRAPTGDLNARVAGDVRSGGLKADVVWACDPLTMQDYVDQGLVGAGPRSPRSPTTCAPTTTWRWPSSTWWP